MSSAADQLAAMSRPLIGLGKHAPDRTLMASAIVIETRRRVEAEGAAFTERGFKAVADRFAASLGRDKLPHFLGTSLNALARSYGQFYWSPTIYIVGCGAEKRSTAAMPWDLYTGPLYRAALTHVVERRAPFKILSALHGLMDPFVCENFNNFQDLNSVWRPALVAPYDYPLSKAKGTRYNLLVSRVAAQLHTWITRLRTIGFDAPALGNVPRPPWPGERDSGRSLYKSLAEMGAAPREYAFDNPSRTGPPLVIEVHAGEDYTQLVKDALAETTLLEKHSPVVGRLRGLEVGERLAWYKQHREGEIIR